MPQILPPESKVVLRRRLPSAHAATLDRADAAAIVVAGKDRAAALARLPYAALWQALHRAASRATKMPLLVAPLPNARHTLAAIGFLRDGATAFERLGLAGRLMRELVTPGVATLQCHAAGCDADAGVAVHEALASAALAAAAPMPKRHTDPPSPPDLRTVALCTKRVPDLDRCAAIAAGNHLARWLTSLPPNELDCVAYRRVLAGLARREGWRFRFFDERALARLGAGAFLAVTRANAHRGAGIAHLSYRPRGVRKPRRVALVGKGICFDTGGVNLKTHRSMFHMHGDMQGSAVAVGTLLALARLGTPLAIDAWLALTENEIGPRAYRPQDVVRAANGTTIQVVHSDAEGRMVLADTLVLAARMHPSLVVDFATLTSACVNALTERYSGAFTNRPDLQGPLQDAGRDCGERVWCFPMEADFDAELESPIADVMQCPLDAKGDHIYAARFLNRFVPQDVPWVHLDLAASERKGGLAHVPTDFTGFGVRLATHLLRDRAFLERLEPPS